MTGLSATEVASAIRYRSHIQAMMSDPDLTGNTLLLALAMENRCLLKRESGQEEMLTKWTGVCADLGWATDGWQYELREAIRRDIPRYEVPRVSRFAAECAAPMIRREGPCGKPAASSLIFEDRDPETREGRQVGFCSRHGALQHDVRKRIRAWVLNDRPQPPHNTGGVLARYFSGLEPAYKWANFGCDLTPGSGKPPTPPEPPRPRLTLVQGGAA